MATKNFRSTVLEPTSEFAHGDKLRFTALATVGEVLKGSFSEATIGEDGVYSIDLQYGKHRIDYKPYEGCWRHFADVEVNADTLSTTLQDLALASVPVTDETVLVLQGILADAETAKTAAETAGTAAETALASIDSKIAEVEAGYPALLAAQLSKTVTVNASTGDDTTADGTEIKPFKTIHAAVESQPDLISLVVDIKGGETKESAHILSKTVAIKGRRLTLKLNGNHVLIDDSITDVFYISSGGSLQTDGQSSGYFYASTDKNLILISGDCSIHIGSYYNVYFKLKSGINFYLTKNLLASSRGVSRISTTKMFLTDIDNESIPTTANVIDVNKGPDGLDSASVLISHNKSSLGTNYSSGAYSLTLAGGLSAVSV